MDNFVKMMNKLTKLYEKLPRKAAVVAERFSKERFRKGGWQDKTFDKWDDRKRNTGKRSGRGTLIDTGRLKRSIRVSRVTSTYAIIAVGGTGINYAQIHNEGGHVNTTANIAEHTRREHSRKRKGRGRETVKAHKVKAHTRKVEYDMPKRQFIGESQELEKQIEKMITDEIINALK